MVVGSIFRHVKYLSSTLIILICIYYWRNVTNDFVISSLSFHGLSP